MDPATACACRPAATTTARAATRVSLPEAVSSRVSRKRGRPLPEAPGAASLSTSPQRSRELRATYPPSAEENTGRTSKAFRSSEQREATPAGLGVNPQRRQNGQRRTLHVGLQRLHQRVRVHHPAGWREERCGSFDRWLQFIRLLVAHEITAAGRCFSVGMSRGAERQHRAGGREVGPPRHAKISLHVPQQY